MSYWIVLYGPGPDGKPIEYPLADPFPTIKSAEAKARRLGALGPGQITPFHGGKAATNYRIRDERKVIVSQGAFDANRT
jgi:hypothetical protein